MARTRGTEQGHSPKDEWQKSAGGPPHCSRLGSQDGLPAVVRAAGPAAGPPAQAQACTGKSAYALSPS